MIGSRAVSRILSVGKPNGQSLVLLVLTLFLLTLMVLMTLSFGATASRRMDLNNVADAAALSQATATARTMNSAAVLNRTMVSHYVVMAGVQAQIAYASAGHNYFNLAANQIRMMDMAGVATTQQSFSGNYPNLPGCPARSQQVKDGSYELWHAALSWYARGSAPDNVNAGCVNGVCNTPRNWIAQSIGQLEVAATDQIASVHHAIADLANIEAATYRDLQGRVVRGDFLAETARVANIQGVFAAGQSEADEELAGAFKVGTATPNGGPTFSHPFAEAIMGSRPRERLLLPIDILGRDPENLSPLTRRLKAEVDAALAAYPGGRRFTVSFTPGDTSADFSLQGIFAQRMWEQPLWMGWTSLTPRMTWSFGRYQNEPGAVTVTYDDPCVGSRTIMSGSGGSHGAGSYVALPMGVIVRSSPVSSMHFNYESMHVDGAHWAGNGGCHGTHSHYGWSSRDIHRLDEEVLPGDVLGFALPDQNMAEKGAGGLWGQPVLPVIATRAIDPAADPFNLAPFFFRFSRTSGQNGPYDMQRAIDQLTAVSAGITYYHRRDHLGEPPNLLNPYWRATLVPIELDDRVALANGQFADPTAASKDTGDSTLETVLRTQVPGYRERSEALAAYRGLYGQIDGMGKTPALEPP
jgi:hypothetical protein